MTRHAVPPADGGSIQRNAEPGRSPIAHAESRGLEHKDGDENARPDFGRGTRNLRTGPDPFECWICCQAQGLEVPRCVRGLRSDSDCRQLPGVLEPHRLRAAVASIQVKNEHQALDLLSPNFFDAERFPRLEFRSTAVSVEGDGNLKVAGELSCVEHPRCGRERNALCRRRRRPWPRAGRDRSSGSGRSHGLRNLVRVESPGRRNRRRDRRHTHRRARVHQVIAVSGTSITVLGISGSLRRDSHNTRLLKAAARLFPTRARDVPFAGLGSIPPFNEDEEHDPPRAVVEWRGAIHKADGLRSRRRSTTLHYRGSSRTRSTGHRALRALAPCAIRMWL